MSFSSTLVGYKIVFKKSAEKELKTIPLKLAKNIEQRIIQLTQDVSNLDIKKLVGYEKPTHRLRVGDYRVIFEIHNKEIIILIVSIKHRREAY